ncbi:MAG: MoaD/ThiS family protein [Nitrososphaerota archaeon]|nr:MoaD/ThiS family protein [Candidatus Bathyarchaeota archaeon]MCX8162334.1 MoaD/ThiS family protein [Candidatus Bathyarchaeota archaeon]MDW8061527.1 MoaD/ThiS family protein [Nitrososphaerota archaeon]
MNIEVELLGALARIAGSRYIRIEVADDTTVRGILSIVKGMRPGMEEYIVLRGDTASNIIVLVDGRDIGVLDGLETKLRDGCKITLIPVIHGG